VLSAKLRPTKNVPSAAGTRREASQFMRIGVCCIAQVKRLEGLLPVRGMQS